jgi:hypothetical protein
MQQLCPLSALLASLLRQSNPCKAGQKIVAAYTPASAAAKVTLSINQFFSAARCCAVRRHQHQGLLHMEHGQDQT